MEGTVAHVPLCLQLCWIHDTEVGIEPFIRTESSCNEKCQSWTVNWLMIPMMKVMMATMIMAMTVDTQTSMLKGSMKESRLGGAWRGLM